MGYNAGLFAPGRTSDRSKSDVGDSSREHLIVGHSLLLGHARAVRLYRAEFKEAAGGQIGATLNGNPSRLRPLPHPPPATDFKTGDWTEPFDPSDPLDIAAAERKLEFSISWFADPINFGDYPQSLKTQYGDRLPVWTPQESALVKGSNDFYGMNHYTANYVKHLATPAPLDDVNGNVEMTFINKAGECIGPETQSVWLRPHLICWCDATWKR